MQRCRCTQAPTQALIWGTDAAIHRSMSRSVDATVRLLRRSMRLCTDTSPMQLCNRYVGIFVDWCVGDGTRLPCLKSVPLRLFLNLANVYQPDLYIKYFNIYRLELLYYYLYDKCARGCLPQPLSVLHTHHHLGSPCFQQKEAVSAKVILET